MILGAAAIAAARGRPAQRLAVAARPARRLSAFSRGQEAAADQAALDLLAKTGHAARPL